MAKDDFTIPKYTYDLLLQLDRDYQLPRLPLTAEGWQHMDEARARELAFIAGQRALVNLLLEWQEESNRVDGDVEDKVATSGPTVYDSEFGRVLDPSIAGDPDMEPIRVASASLGALLDTGDNEE